MDVLRTNLPLLLLHLLRGWLMEKATDDMTGNMA
jgi:hypothetical protein